MPGTFVTQQDYISQLLRPSTVLTNSYVASTILGPDFYSRGVENNNQLVIYFNFTIGSLTDAQIKVEFSPDGTTWYQESFSSISGATDTVSLGIHKFTATGGYRLAMPIKDRYIKISAVGTGTVTGSLLAIEAVIGVA